MKPKSIDDLGDYEYCLVSMCEELHELTTGSLESGLGKASAIARLIRRRLAKWDNRNEKVYRDYSNCVKALCEQALADYDASWLRPLDEEYEADHDEKAMWYFAPQM